MSSVASLLMHDAKSTQALRTSFFGWGATTCSCARYNTVCASLFAKALVELDLRRLCWPHRLPCNYSVYVYFAVRWAFVPVDLQIYPEVLHLFVQLARTGHIQNFRWLRSSGVYTSCCSAGLLFCCSRTCFGAARCSVLLRIWDGKALSESCQDCFVLVFMFAPVTSGPLLPTLLVLKPRRSGLHRCRYDAIVIGVGGMGSAALYQLAKRGTKVCD